MTPSLGGWPAKAKEAPSPHEVRLAPLDTKPGFLSLGGNLGKGFSNYLSTDIKLSKTQLSKMIQSEGFLGRLLGPLLKTGLPLTKNVIEPLAKSILIPLGLTAAVSAANARIHKKS